MLVLKRLKFHDLPQLVKRRPLEKDDVMNRRINRISHLRCGNLSLAETGRDSHNLPKNPTWAVPSMRHRIALSILLVLCLLAGTSSMADTAGEQEVLKQYTPSEFAALRKAAQRGDVQALNVVAMSYAAGIFVQQDEVEAVRLYRKAAEKGYAPAQNNLGVMYHHGRGVPRDDQEAFRWFQKAAEQGHVRGQYNLAGMYYSGFGVAKNLREAAVWFEVLARKGEAQAQNNIGYMYDQGLGVRKNSAMAATWYRRSAEQGWAEAQNNLALLYEAGEGVPQDANAALAWFTKSAQQGFMPAQASLGRLYLGKGDYVNAYVWLLRAKASGDADGEDAAMLSSLESQLNAAQREIAQRSLPTRSGPETSVEQ